MMFSGMRPNPIFGMQFKLIYAERRNHEVLAFYIEQAEVELGLNSGWDS